PVQGGRQAALVFARPVLPARPAPALLLPEGRDLRLQHGGPLHRLLDAPPLDQPVPVPFHGATPLGPGVMALPAPLQPLLRRLPLRRHLRPAPPHPLEAIGRLPVAGDGLLQLADPLLDLLDRPILPQVLPRDAELAG